MGTFVTNVAAVVLFFVYLLLVMVMADLVERYTGISGIAVSLALLTLTYLCLVVWV